VKVVHAWHILPLVMSHTSFPFLVSNSLVIELTYDRDKYIMSCFTPVVKKEFTYISPPTVQVILLTGGNSSRSTK